MQNIINFYYNLYPVNISKRDNYYYFVENNKYYFLIPYDRDIKDSKSLYQLNKMLIDNNIYMHEWILNKNNELLTSYNNVSYLLYKINLNINKKTTLSHIAYLSNININLVKDIVRDNWISLWMDRVDYLEYQINQMGKKYPIIVESFNYFVGMTENAISYIKNTTIETKMNEYDMPVLSHRRIHNTINSLYNPINIIFDHRSRDISEYIKLSFFNNNKNIYNELDLYFKYNYFSEYGIRLLFGRVLYPSFYFDMYEDTILTKREEISLLDLTKRIDEYENYLKDIYFYLKKYYDLPEVKWISKKNKVINPQH